MRPRSPLLPPALVLEPVSRRPTRLPDATVQFLLTSDLPRAVPVAQPNPSAGRLASVIIATSNNCLYLKLCVASVLLNTPAGDYELIIIDNGSNDGAAEYLRELSVHHEHVQVIYNDHNRGFAPANNQGLGRATGDVIVLLNDDTIVPPHWLRRVRVHLRDRSVGLVGPVTNRAGNDAQIETAYRTYGEFEAFARQRSRERRGQLRDIGMLTMFCLAMRRDAFNEIGPLDERFAVGMFEDDDYSIRARAAGYRLACADDVFVHHFGATSIGKLAADGRFGTLFEANRRRFEEKWQRPWTPHQRTLTDQQAELGDTIEALVCQHVVEGERLLVITKGDDRLVRLAGRQTEHFPASADGTYAGYHPATDFDAIALLEAKVSEGVSYLVVPAPSRWWLTHYPKFASHLRERHRLVADHASCVLFQLVASPGDASDKEVSG